MPPCWEGRQVAWWGPAEDQALKAQVSLKLPSGKRGLAPSEEHGSNQQDVSV